jgi:hypothetical protein
MSVESGDRGYICDTFHRVTWLIVLRGQHDLQVLRCKGSARLSNAANCLVPLVVARRPAYALVAMHCWHAVRASSTCCSSAVRSPAAALRSASSAASLHMSGTFLGSGCNVTLR